jgi:hypothetical protein
MALNGQRSRNMSSAQCLHPALSAADYVRSLPIAARVAAMLCRIWPACWAMSPSASSPVARVLGRLPGQEKQPAAAHGRRERQARWWQLVTGSGVTCHGR